MSDVDGTWNTEVNTPMGEQQGQLTVNSDGDTFTGNMSGDRGTLEITDGAVDGNKLTWTAQISEPMSMKLSFSVEVNGDEMSGNVQLGMFGNAPLKGTRA